MARYWLGPWEWNASGPSGGWQKPAAAVAAVDLRSRPQCAATVTPRGDGLFVTANGSDLGSDYDDLGTDPDVFLAAGRRVLWRDRFRLPQALEAQSLREAVWETLTIQADPLGEDRCGPIVPTNAREFELWLAGQRIFNHRFAADRPEWVPVIDMLKRQYRSLRRQSLDGEMPPLHYRKVLGYWVRKYGLNYRAFQPADLPNESDVTPETTYSDGFGRANNDSLGSPWTEVSGDVDILSNTATHQAGGSFAIATVRYDADLSSDDHYCEIDYFNADVAGDAQAAATARHSSSDFTWYYTTILSNVITLGKVISGTFTSLGTAAQTQGASELLQVWCNGSTIKAFRNSVEKISVTDTDVAGNLRAGFWTYQGTGQAPRLNNWEAEDLAPSVKPWNYYAQL